MSDQDLVVETVRDILGGHEPFVLTPERPWDRNLWRDLAGAGLTGVGVPEEAGGSGGEWADAVAVVRTLAAGAAAVPVAEQLLVAGPALLAAGLPVPPSDEPLSVALDGAVTAELAGEEWSLTGTVVDVPASLDSPDPLGRALAEAQLHAPGYTLRGGTNEILRGIVARGLGLR